MKSFSKSFQNKVVDLWNSSEKKYLKEFERHKNELAEEVEPFENFIVWGDQEFVDSVTEVLRIFDCDYPYLYRLCCRYPIRVVEGRSESKAERMSPHFLFLDKKEWLSLEYGTRIHYLLRKVIQKRFLRNGIPPVFGIVKRIDSITYKYTLKLSSRQFGKVP